MKFRFYHMTAALTALVLLLAFLPGCRSLEEHNAYYFDYFDTFSSFTAYTANADEFARYDTLVKEKMAYYHNLLNGFPSNAAATSQSSTDVSSVLCASSLAELNELAGKGPVKVPEELFIFLQYGKEAWELSLHRVNMAMGSVTRIWKAQLDSETPSVPSQEELQEASLYTSIEELILNEKDLTVTLPEGMILDVGAIAKGYVAGKLRDALKEAGCSIFLLSLGGNILSEGAPPRQQGWPVGIANPRYEEGSSESNLLEAVTLKDASLVTSGDYERYFELDGVRYHHIIDPDTLQPGGLFASVTVCCRDAALSDLLSTTLFLLPMEDGVELTRQLCSSPWSLVYVDLDGKVSHFSKD